MKKFTYIQGELINLLERNNKEIIEMLQLIGGKVSFDEDDDDMNIYPIITFNDGSLGYGKLTKVELTDHNTFQMEIYDEMNDEYYDDEFNNGCITMTDSDMVQLHDYLIDLV